MIDLRRNTEQSVIIGVLRTAKNNTPVVGGLLSWYYWKYLIKANGESVNILNHSWSDITSCAGVYRLTLTPADTGILGQLFVLINDVSLIEPVFARFKVINENTYDSIYGCDYLLNVSVRPVEEGINLLNQKIPEIVRPDGTIN